MGKQKTKPKQEELEGPPVPSITAEQIALEKTTIQMTPSQLSARLAAAKTDEAVESALESTLNYINTLSSDMSDKEYKENDALLQQIIIVGNAQVERELNPILAEECRERLNELLKMPHAEAKKLDIPLQFQQFGFFPLADIAGAGSVAFGNLPSEQAFYIPEEFQGAALEALNKLANPFFSGAPQSEKAKAGKEYLKFIEGLAKDRWGNDADAVESMVCNVISAGTGGGCGQAKQDLRSGNYGYMFTDPDNPMSEWQRAGTENYLTWTSKEMKLVLSVEAAKYILKKEERLTGVKGEFGVKGAAKAYKETTRSVRQGEPGLFGREEKSKYAAGGAGGLYGEIGGRRWKAGASVEAEYVPGEQGGWFVPVEAFGEITAGTDATSQTIRLQVKASPEVTGNALTLEGGVLWNALFFQKGDTAVGYVFGVKAARMSVEANGTQWVDLVIEGQLGPTFQKIFREKGLVLWTGIAGIVQQEIPQGTGAAGPLEQRTKVGAGWQLGLGGEKAEGFLQIQLNPIPVTPATDFVGRNEQGGFQGVLFVGGIKF